MEEELIKNGLSRLNNLLEMMVNCEDKQKLISLSNNFLADIGDFIHLLYVVNGVSKKDLDQFEEENAVENIMEDLNEDEIESTDLNDNEDYKVAVEEGETVSSTTEDVVDGDS
jgi:hypothetical protein